MLNNLIKGSRMLWNVPTVLECTEYPKMFANVIELLRTT